MVVYNITTKVHQSIDKLWLQWQKEEYMPQIMSTGFFISNKLFRLLEQDDSEGNTYAVQYTAASQQDYDNYMHVHNEQMRNSAIKKWGNRIISFHSALQVIH